MREGGIIALMLAMAGMSPAAAERPLAPAAQRFADALDRGDLRTLRRVTPRSVRIERMQPNGSPSQAIRPPVTLAGLLASVRGCETGWRSGHRELRDRRRMRAFFFWRCAGDRDPMVNLDIVDGRVTRVETGWEIEQRPFMMPPGSTFPPLAVTDRVNLLLYPLVGERRLEQIREHLPANTLLFDRLRNRTVDLAAIADHVEPCSLRDVAELGASSAITRWACPDGERAIAVGYDGDRLKSIEIVPATAPVGGSAER